jgi:hypothetical protein
MVIEGLFSLSVNRSGGERESTSSESLGSDMLQKQARRKNKCKCSARRRPKTESGEEIHISNCPEYPQEVKVMAESPHDTKLGAAEATKPQPWRTAETVSKATLSNIGRCNCQAHRRRRMESGAENHFNYCPAYFKVSENTREEGDFSENVQNEEKVSGNPQKEVELSEYPQEEFEVNENPQEEEQVSEYPHGEEDVSDCPQEEINEDTQEERRKRKVKAPNHSHRGMQ